MTKDTGTGGELAARIRKLLHTYDMTVKELSDRTGIPKRSLENYMRKENPQMPGVEAAVKIAKGIGVSLDWLLMGPEEVQHYHARMAKLAAKAASQPILENIYRTILCLREIPDKSPVEGGKLVGLDIEEWARLIGEGAEFRVSELAKTPVSLRTLEIQEKILYPKG